MVEYGYVKVSSRDQNVSRQILAMQEFGISEENIFTDKQSGKSFERPVYKKLFKRFKVGDTLVIKNIDRLGRNYGEILRQWRLLMKEKGIAIVLPDMPLLNTRQRRDLTDTLISDIVLQLLSYVAETERNFIRQRQAEGTAAAQARGVHFGKPPLPIPAEFYLVWEKWQRNEVSLTRAAVELDVSRNTFKKWICVSSS